jgi:hypothetical protein
MIAKVKYSKLKLKNLVGRTKKSNKWKTGYKRLNVRK